MAVHPHGCGERNPIPAVGDVLDGSSPRLWGTPLARNGTAKSSRFIPTAVGNARPRGSTHKPGPVHPHGCGERIGFAYGLALGNGSSPRLWGTQQ